MRIETPVTRLLGIDLPIVQAGMSWASSCSALPLAVSAAGGLGTIAAGPMRIADLARVIDEVRAGTDKPFAVNVPLYRKGVEEVLDLLAEKKPPVIVASQGGPQRYLRRFKDLGAVCLHVVAGVLHARKAAEAGVDGLVVVGAEAGGHPPPDMISSLVVVRAVVRALPDMPIIASGGFADGAGLAAALSLGAGAAQFGTRFIATPESNVHAAYKARILEAGIGDTRTVGRGLGVIRAMANDFTAGMEKLEQAGIGIDERRALFGGASLKQAAFDGDVDGGKVEAGQSVGLVGSIEPAADVVHAIAAQYLAVRAALPTPS